MLAAFFGPILARITARATFYVSVALAVVLILLSVYAKGRQDGANLTELKYSTQRQEWEAKVRQAEADILATNTMIVNDYIEEAAKVQAEMDRLSKRPKIVYKYIPSKVNVQVPKGFVELHNIAAKGEHIGKPSPGADQLSDKKLTDVVSVVATNYYQCNAEKAQLTALQAVVDNFQKKQKGLLK